MIHQKIQCSTTW